MRKSFFPLLLFALSACAAQPPLLVLSPESLQDRQLQTRSFETSNPKIIVQAASSVLQDLGFNIVEAEIPLGLLVGAKTRDATDTGQVVVGAIHTLLTGKILPVDEIQTIRISMVIRGIPHKKTAEQESMKKVQAEEIDTFAKQLQDVIAESLANNYPKTIGKKTALQLAKNTAQTFRDDLHTLVATQAGSGESFVRVTFQRTIWDTEGNVTKNEQITEPDMYVQFFESLSKALFLEAQNI